MTEKIVMLSDSSFDYDCAYLKIKCESTQLCNELKQQILHALPEYQKLKNLCEYFMCDNYEDLFDMLKANSHRLTDLLVENQKLKAENEELRNTISVMQYDRNYSQ